MLLVSVSEFRANFSKYLLLLINGTEEEIIITRRGKRVVKVVPYELKKNHKRVGAGVGILEDKPYTLDDIDGDIPELFGY